MHVNSGVRLGLFVLLIGAGQAAVLRAADADGPTTKPALPAPDADGFISLFNGKDLAGWEGLPGYWSVNDDAIDGTETRENSKQTFLVLSASLANPEKFANFELRLKYRFVGDTGNSGVQFRSKVMDATTYRVGGYQADMDPARRYDGGIYDEGGQAGGRQIMANRGFKTTWDENNARKNEPLGENAQQALQAFVNPPGKWNDMTIVASGPHITITINGHLMCDVLDQSPKAVRSGLIAIQLHQGFTMTIQMKDIRIKLPDGRD